MNIADIIVASVFISAAVAVTLVPLIYGAVKKALHVKPVEYIPPDGMSPVDMLIEYYGAFAEPREIFNPLMLYWAERGVITVEEDCKRGLKLTKLNDLEPPENCNAQTFKIERELFNYIFSGKTKVFYTLSAYDSFKQKFEELAEKCRGEAKKITAEKSKKFCYLSVVLSFFMFVAVTLTVGLSLADNITVMAVFPFVSMCMAKAFFAIPDIKRGLKVFLFAFFTMFGIPFIVMITFIPTEAMIIMVSAMVVCLLNVYFLSDKIDIRTDGQLKTYVKICGFKKFLLRAEVKQLEMLVEENPQYYYNILPYCYVLKITHKLKPKFDAIALDGPAWYLGDIRDVLMF